MILNHTNKEIKKKSFSWMYFFKSVSSVIQNNDHHSYVIIIMISISIFIGKSFIFKSWIPIFMCFISLIVSPIITVLSQPNFFYHIGIKIKLWGKVLIDLWRLICDFMHNLTTCTILVLLTFRYSEVMPSIIPKFRFRWRFNHNYYTS